MRLQKSRHNLGAEILGVLSSQQAEQLLMDWANLQGPWPLHTAMMDWTNLQGPWPLNTRMYDPLPLNEEIDKAALMRADTLRSRYGTFLKEMGIKAPISDAERRAVGHPWLRDMLRRAWETANQREREWLCFRLREKFSVMIRHRDMPIEEIRKEELSVVKVEGPHYAAPPITLFEAALWYFQQQSKRAHVCGNQNCPHPYFFAKTRQRFCSPLCGNPSRRASKNAYWERNKERLNAKARAKRKSKKKRRK